MGRIQEYLNALSRPPEIDPECQPRFDTEDVAEVPERDSEIEVGEWDE